MMKLLLPCALLLLTSVDGNLRGDLDKRALKKDKDTKCKGKDCDSAPAAAPSTPGTAPPTPAFKTPSMDVCQETGDWKKEDVVPCTSNDMCKDYQSTVGTVCCLAMSCTCGSTVDEDAGTDRCGNFGGESFFTNDITVPTIRLPTTQAIEAESLPSSAPLTPTNTPSSAPSPTASDAAETAFTSGITSDTGPVNNVPDITVPSNFFDWQP